MFKKIFFILILLLFGSSVLFISLQESVYVHSSFAAATLTFTVSPSEPPDSNASVEYPMPYPGILPDSPFYKIKMIRDRVWFWLTTNRTDRIELLILYSDKRIGAGKALIEGNKVALGISTLIKGEKYLERALWEIERAKNEGKQISMEIIEKPKKAVLKHKEILKELEEKVSPEGKSALNDLLRFNQDLQERLRNI